MNASEHAAEAEQLLKVGQAHLNRVENSGPDDSVDLAGLYFDKAAVHARLAIASSLEAIARTDLVVDDAVAAIREGSSSQQFLEKQRAATRRVGM